MNHMLTIENFILQPTPLYAIYCEPLQDYLILMAAIDGRKFNIRASYFDRYEVIGWNGQTREPVYRDSNGIGADVAPYDERNFVGYFSPSEIDRETSRQIKKLEIKAERILHELMTYPLAKVMKRVGCMKEELLELRRLNHLEMTVFTQ